MYSVRTAVIMNQGQDGKYFLKSIRFIMKFFFESKRFFAKVFLKSCELF